MNPKIKKIKIGENTYDIVSTQNIQKVETFNDIPNEELSLYKYASSDGATSSPIVEVLAEYHAGGDNNTFSVTSTANNNNNQVSVSSFYSHFDSTLSNFMTVTEATNAYTLNYALPITGIRLGTGKATGKLAFNLKSNCTISVRKYFGFNGSTNTITSYDSMSKVIVDGSTEYQFTADDTPVLIELAAGDHTIESYFESSAGRIIITQFAFSGEAYYSYTKKHLARQEDLDQVNSTLTAATEELNTKVTTNIKAIEQNKQEITALKANNDFIKIIDVNNLPKASINHLKTLYRCDNELYQCISQGEGVNKEFVFNLSGTSEITSTVLDNVYTEIDKDFSDYFEISYLSKVFRNNGLIKLGSSSTGGNVGFAIVNNLPLLDATIKVRAYNSKKSCFYFEISTDATDYFKTILIEDAINDTTISLKNLLPEDIDLNTETISYIRIDTSSSYTEDDETITVDPRGLITSINATFGEVSYKWEAITSKQISITWADLKNLRDNGKLIPGQEYRIIDYVTTTSQTDTTSAGHCFDIIVKALNNFMLSEEAKTDYHINEDGSADGYFLELETLNTVTEASFVDNMSLGLITTTFKIFEEEEGNYNEPTIEDKQISGYTSRTNRYGVEVPCLLNQAEDADTVDYLMYSGDFEWTELKNTLVSIVYTLGNGEEIEYEGTSIGTHSDIFVEIAYKENTPILYKENIKDYGIDSVDYEDYYEYIGDFEVDGTIYNRWTEQGPNVGTGQEQRWDILTNVIVENNEFIYTQEEFKNGIQEVTVTYNKWEECDAYGNNTFLQGNNYTVYMLTNNIVKDVKLESIVNRNYKANLAAWKIKYCLDNDVKRFTWAGNADGKGVIYWMKDEWENECPYDFKNILFKRYAIGTALSDCSGKNLTNWGIPQYIAPTLSRFTVGPSNYATPIDTSLWCYTFTSYFDYTVQDSSVTLNGSYSLVQDQESRWHISKNRIDTYYTAYNRAYLNNIVLIDADGDCQTYNNLLGSYNNIFKSGCHDITFTSNCSNNTIASNCSHILFLDYCLNNNISNSCRDILFFPNCSNNIINNESHVITLVADVQYSTFGNNCSNVFIKGPNGTSTAYFRYVHIEDHIYKVYIRTADYYGTNFYSNITCKTGFGGNVNKTAYVEISPDKDEVASRIITPANQVEFICAISDSYAHVHI